MNEEVLVKVDNISKKFCRSLKRSLWYGLQDIGSEMIGRSNHHNDLRKNEFWAVKDVSFELRRGECLGLIGHNGAGKSTLLRMLNGLIKPDQGQISIKGRVGALIQLGAGFNPILTGRENIYVNGQILGFSKKEIDAKFDAIVDFSEIEEFIDTPVQNYSSGMKVRLGFAVASQLEPDVLLVDEVLAVGDVGFRTKCFNKIGELLEGTAVIFVSHSMPNIGRLCTDILLMDHGKNEYYGENIAKGIEKYHDKFSNNETQLVGSGKAKILNMLIYPHGEGNGKDIYTIPVDREITVEMEVMVDPDIRKFSIAIGIFDMTLRSIALVYSKRDDLVFENNSDSHKVKIKIPNYFAPENYSLNIFFYEESENKLNYGKALAGYISFKKFKVVGSNLISYTPIQLKSDWILQ